MELKLTRPLIFLDLETTGINVAKDRIIEVCFLKIMPDGQQQIKTQRVNPTIPISPAAIAVHGITDEDVKDCPTFAALAAEFANFISNADLSGYNAIKFDIPVLAEEFLRTDVDFDLKNRKIIDVQNIFHKMEPRTLGAAYRFYCNQELTNAHQAEADTIATFEILKAQLDRYAGKEYVDKNDNRSYPIVNDTKALSDFSYYSKNADLVGHIIYNEKGEEVFNFGKYKGLSVEGVFAKEPAYYDWMMKSEFPLVTKKTITAIKLRGFNNKSVNINS